MGPQVCLIYTSLGADTNAASPAEYRDLMADALTTDDVVDVE